MASSQQNPKLALAMGGAVMIFGVAVGAFVMLAPQSDMPGEPSPEPTVAVERTPAIEHGTRPEPQAVAPVAEPSPEPGSPRSKPNRMARDLEREQIWKALGRKHELAPATPGSAAPTEADADKLPALDPEYVRGAIKEQLVPVAIDCYDAVLAKDPSAGGKLVFEFTIIGDEEVGGVVEEVAVADESTFGDEFLRECLRESLLAVTFPPPSDGGRVEVRYPLNFSPDEDEGPTD